MCVGVAPYVQPPCLRNCFVMAAYHSTRGIVSKSMHFNAPNVGYFVGTIGGRWLIFGQLEKALIVGI